MIGGGGTCLRHIPPHTYRKHTKIISQTLTNLRAANLIRADIDITLEANAIVALVDGIGTGSVIYPEQFSAEQQKYLVLRHISVLSH